MVELAKRFLPYTAIFAIWRDRLDVRRSRPVIAFAVLATLAVIGSALLGAVAGGAPAIVAGAALTAAAALVGFDLNASYPHARLGMCNVITLFRLALTTTLAAWLIVAPSPYWIIAVATLAFAMDGLDGWFARRSGLASRFGARFDVETDSLLALILSVHVAQVSPVGVAALLLGLPRYLFALGQWVFPWLNGPLPERFTRKIACVVQIAALIVLLVPGLSAIASVGIFAAAASALIWSFWLDVVALRRVVARS